MAVSCSGVGRSLPSHCTTPSTTPAEPKMATTTSTKNSFQGKRAAARTAGCFIGSFVGGFLSRATLGARSPAGQDAVAAILPRNEPLQPDGRGLPLRESPPMITDQSCHRGGARGDDARTAV